jgi:hypothetical protein
VWKENVEARDIKFAALFPNLVGDDVGSQSSFCIFSLVRFFYAVREHNFLTTTTTWSCIFLFSH